MAQYVGGIVARFASTETVGGEVTDPSKALETSINVFQYIGWAGIFAGVVLFLLAVPLRWMMHGVK
jgi:POT family proton-dependent oligopeptide transporter